MEASQPSSAQATTGPSAPRVSAIVLSYNNAAGLERCLRALEASTIRKEIEILVMENGSTDNSVALDVVFPNVTFMRLPRNFGATKALNIGMRTAQAEYFFYLTPEIEVAPDAIAKLAAFLDGEPNAAAACPLVTDGEGRQAGDVWRLPNTDTLKQTWRELSLPRVEVPTGEGPVPIGYGGRIALMARKFFVRGLNYFDEHYGDFGADLDLAWQIRRAGRKTMLVPDAVATRTSPMPLPSSAKNTILADRASGIVRYLSKTQGGTAGFFFQTSAVLSTLGRFQFGLLVGLLNGSKIDGSQSTL